MTTSTLAELTGRTVVICEDDRGVLAMASRTLRDAGFTVRAAPDAPRALRYMLTIPPPSFFLLDVFLPDIKGLDLFRLTRKYGSTVPTILMTGYPIEMVAIDQVELGLSCIQKPFDSEQLLEQMLRFMKSAPTPEPPGEPIVKSQGITVNLHTRYVTRGDRTTRLTDKELDVFFHLLMLPGKSIAHDTLLEAYFDPTWTSVHPEYRNTFRTLRAKMTHRDEDPIIVPTRDGWKMVSAYETLQRIIRRAWAANETRLKLPPLPHDVLGWDDDDPNRPRRWDDDSEYDDDF
ncbi:MAG TPA: response regulator [Gemmatimonadaceae bacterium]|nr:response regulator [Gemmatimonadaceae bacterium]